MIKRTIILLFIFLLTLSFTIATTDFTLSAEQSLYTVGWGGSVTPKFFIYCNNDLWNCLCSAKYGTTSYVSIGSFDAKESNPFTIFQQSVSSCGTGSSQTTVTVKCHDSLIITDVYDSVTVTVKYPTASQESTYNSADSKRSSANSRVNSASAAISDAIAAINNGKSYGTACVDVSQAESYLQTAQSRKTSASSSLSSANSYWSQCSYSNALNSASSAESVASESIDYANKAKNSAQSAIDSYNSKKSQAISDIAAAESAIQSAQTAIDDANDLVEKAKSKSSCIKVANIEQRLITAAESLNSAVVSKSSAESMKTSCSFSTVRSYTSSSQTDSNSARDIGLNSKQEIVNLLNEYDSKKGNADIEANAAKNLIEAVNEEINAVEVKLKTIEAKPCIEEVGLADAIALKTEAESFLRSANEQYTLGKSNYDSCDFDASSSNYLQAQQFANQAKPKVTETANRLDSISEKVENLRAAIADDINKVKNKIEIAENMDNTIGTLLETNPEETLGKKAFSEAKAKREQGREKIRAAKTEYEYAGIDFGAGDCSKARNTIGSADGYAADAESMATEAHNWITLKIQEAGDCANRINNANEEVNKLYFKSEFGRVFIVDSLASLVNLSSNNIELPHVSSLLRDVREQGTLVLINLDKAKLRLDEGNFQDCLGLAGSVRDSAVEIRRKSEEAAAEISKDMQKAIPLLIEIYAEQNNNAKKAISGKSKYAITDTENIGIASTKAKENDVIIEEIKSESQTLSSLNGLDDVMAHSQAIALKANKIENNTGVILVQSLPRVNKTFYHGLLIGVLATVLIAGGAYGALKMKRKRAKANGNKDSEPEKKANAEQSSPNDKLNPGRTREDKKEEKLETAIDDKKPPVKKEPEKEDAKNKSKPK